jgi:benzoate-CoA ligase family protein
VFSDVPREKRRVNLSVELNEEGIPELRFPQPFNSAEYFIDRHLAEGRGSKVAVRTLEREVTYAELHDNVNRFGNTLVNLGAGRGDRVLMVLDDCPEFFFLFWGAVKAGMIPVPLNVLLRAGDFAFVIEHSQCAGLVYSSEFAHEVEAAVKASSWKPKAVLRLHEGEDSLESQARHVSAELRAVPTRAEDDCLYLYSSGTTGRPKGVVHTHADMAICCQFYTAEILGAEESDVFFSVARLFFSYGLGATMAAPLWVGGTAVLDKRRPTLQTVIEVFRHCAPTIFAAVPTFYAKFLAAGALTRHDVSRLRRCVSAAEPLPPELHSRWLEATGVPILEGIGSTEVGHIYISNRMDDIRPGTIGTPVRCYQIRIVDEAGNDVGEETPGRLLVKGQSVTRRYWRDSERTARAIVNGWFDTSDTFRRDKDGHYIFCGRSDDMLKVSGRWVSPFEIESTLAEHPKIFEAAVVGRVDENGLLKAEAWVVLKNPADASEATIADIRAFCKAKLSPYKFPAWINFVDELPKTATGKIQRYKLRGVLQEKAGRA